MPPKPSPASQRTITISYEKYMTSQNELVNAINQHYSVASTMMMASSRSMQTVMGAMFRLRESAHAILTNGGADALPDGVDNYPALATLLKKTQNELLNPLTIPAFDDLGTGLAGLPQLKKQRKKRAPKDPNAPKRPQTAFFLYLDANRGAVKTELGDVAKPGDVARAQRDRWNNLPEKDKEVYKAMYRTNFEGYRQEMDAFLAGGGKVSDADLHLEDDDAVADPSGAADAADSDSESEAESEDSEPEPARTPTPEPPPTKKGKKAAGQAPAKTAASQKAEAAAAAAKAVIPAPVPEKQKRGRPAAVAATPAEKKKGKESAKSASPEESRKAKPVESPEASKKKRKSTGVELEEKRKKRKEAHGDDF